MKETQKPEEQSMVEAQVETPVVEVQPEVVAGEIKIEIVEAPVEVATTEVVTPEVPVVEAEQAVAPEVTAKKLVSIVTEDSVTVTELVGDVENKVERKGLKKRTYKYSDGSEEIATEEYQVVDTFTVAQLEEKVNVAKAEKDTVIATKDEEVKILKAELEQKTQEIETLKVKEEPKKELSLEVGTVEVKERYKEIQKGIDEKAFSHTKNVVR